MSYPPRLRHDKFAVGDEVWWHIPTVMACCRSWSPDITKPTKITAVTDRAPSINNGHTQLVRVSPNYCPFTDEFEGTWLLPVGVRSPNDPAYLAAFNDGKAPDQPASAERDSASEP